MGSMSKERTAMAKVEIPWWVRLIVILGAILTTMGAVIALVHPEMLVSPHDEINGAVHIYAGYLAARNLAMAIMLLAALGFAAKRLLNNLLLLVSLVQFLDALIDVGEGRLPVAIGVIILAVLFSAASASLSGYPFWQIRAWKETD